MRPFKRLKQRRKSRAFKLLLAPIFERFKSDNELESRGYQSHDHFDQWQASGKFFVCRIRENTHKTVIRENATNPGSIVFYDRIVASWYQRYKPD